MRLNTRLKSTETTHEGAPAARMTPMQALRRSVMSCMLWEREFYEDGEEISERIVRLASQVPVSDLAALAVETRHIARLRHVPLVLLSVLAELGNGARVAQAIKETISRADELAELLAVHAARHKVSSAELKPIISAQMKHGLAMALAKFDEYQLAKYDRDGAVKLRDVIRLVHPKPKDAEQAALWKRALNGGLATPDTWEVALSGGANKHEAFTRLLRENKLGYLALLRNLRNMTAAGVDTDLIREAIIARKGAGNVLPFRYIAAARACPQMEPALDQALSEAMLQMPKLQGRTIVIVDVSGSMRVALSARSDMTRMDAGAAVAAIVRESADDPIIYATAGNDLSREHKTALVPPRSGMALVDAIGNMCVPLGGGGIFLKQVMDFVAGQVGTADRVIVVTDEQDCAIRQDDSPLKARVIGKRNYMINVASARNGIGYGRWTHIDGFSESVLRFIHAAENDA